MPAVGTISINLSPSDVGGFVETVFFATGLFVAGFLGAAFLVAGFFAAGFGVGGFVTAGLGVLTFDVGGVAFLVADTAPDPFFASITMRPFSVRTSTQATLEQSVAALAAVKYGAVEIRSRRESNGKDLLGCMCGKVGALAHTESRRRDNCG